MGSHGTLRKSVIDKLSAAATEIFTEFQQTIAKYEEEIARLERLLLARTQGNVCQPDTSFGLDLVKTEPPQEGEALLPAQEPSDDENLQPPPTSENSASAPKFSVCSDVHLLDRCWQPIVILHRIDEHELNLIHSTTAERLKKSANKRKHGMETSQKSGGKGPGPNKRRWQ